MSGTWERKRRGTQDGGDRIAAVSRWIRQSLREPAVHTLRLCQRTEDEWSDIAAWAVKDVTPELAEQVSELVQDAADEQGTHTQLRLQWWSADNKLVMQKLLRAWPREEYAESRYPLDGSMTSLLQQNQRHLEANMQTLVRSIDQQHGRIEHMFQMQTDMMQRIADKLVAAEEVADDARAERDQAIHVAEEAAAAADEAKQAADEAKQDDKMAKVFEIGMKQLMNPEPKSKKPSTGE